MNLENLFLGYLLQISPKSLQLPLEYNYRRITGQLEQELSFLKNLITKPGRGIDIGANRGLYSYALSKICSEVEAFEPQKQCIDIINSYSQKNSKNINTHNCALSNQKGSLTLNIPIIQGKFRTTFSTGLATFGKYEGEYQKIDVPVCKLDQYDFKDVVFIKIDVEGHEKQVIDGAKETIVREHPVLLIEIEQRHLDDTPITNLFDEIRQLGYEGYFVYQGSLLKIEEFSCEKYQKDFLMSSAFSSNYINNFIFKPS